MMTHACKIISPVVAMEALPSTSLAMPNFAMTISTAFVEICFKPFAALVIVFHVQEVRPFGTQSRRKTICQPKRDKLSEARFVAMRQITALVPAAKARL